MAPWPVRALSPIQRREAPVKPTNRAEATAIIGNARKILTPEGIERLEKVLIGVIEQWVITEEPGKVLISLVRYARPIAERAGDVAP